MTNLTLRDRIMPIYGAVAPFIILNLLWIAVSLPIVTMIPATAALLYAMNCHAHGHTADWSTFFQGLRRWFFRSYLWGGLNVVVIVVLIANTAFYTQLQTPWAVIPTALAIGLLVLWLTLQVLTFPLMLQQEKPGLLLALRNSVVLVSRRPLPILGTTLLIALIVAVSTFLFPPAWLFITASLCAYLMNRTALAAICKLMPAPPAAEG